MAKKTEALPTGYVRTLFGSGDDAGTVVVNAKGRELARYYDVTHPFPVTREALEYAFRGMAWVVVDVDGTEHTLTGIDAAAAAKYQHSVEAVRGSIRTDLLKGRPVSPELAQHRFDAAVTFGGKTRSGGRVVATEGELENLSKEEIIKLLKARGAV